MDHMGARYPKVRASQGRWVSPEEVTEAERPLTREAASRYSYKGGGSDSSYFDRYGSGQARHRSYELKGDRHMKSANYAQAASAYKMALKYAPDDRTIWDKHRQAFQMERAIAGYLDKSQALIDRGLYEEASTFLKLALKIDPRNPTIWRLYERALAENPHVVVITTEKEAWDSFRRGREVLDGGRYEAALRYLEPVLAFTQDKKLKYLAKEYAKIAETKIREDYPNLPFRITSR